MNLQGPDLKHNLCGADVRLLHVELRLLGVDIPEEEASENHFGEATREAVLQLQERLDLEMDGIVGRTTAQRINAEVRQRVAAVDAMKQFSRSVKRTLEWSDGFDPRAGNLGVHIKRFSETLRGFAAVLGTLSSA